METVRNTPPTAIPNFCQRTRREYQLKSHLIIACICAGLVLVSCNLKAPDSPSTFRATEFGVSFEMPAGWKMQKVPGLSAPIAHGEARDGFAVNINVVAEPFAGSVADYADGNTKALERGGHKILDRASLTTSAGAPVVRIIGESEQGGRKLRQVFFLLDGRKGNKLVMVCTALAADGTTHDSEFEAAFKTLRVEK